MLLFIRTLAEKQVVLILLDFYAILVSQHWEQRSVFNSSSISSRRRWLRIRLATFQLSSDDKVFSALGTAVLVVTKCWSCVLSTPLACVPVARCNPSSQIVSGSWRLIYRLASSCTVQLVTSFIKAWTFLIFLGQAFQVWVEKLEIFSKAKPRFCSQSFTKAKGRERCTVLSVWLSITNFP